MSSPRLPPGPRAPSALQTAAWVAAPAAFLRACADRYGLPCTVRVAWADAPLVLVADPEDVRRVYAAPPDVLRGGQSSSFLEPFAGPRSILVLDGEEHLRQRKLMLPPFHGDALRAYAPLVRALAEEEVARWVPGRPLGALPRMRALTLEVILRAVFGSGEHLDDVRAAVRRALDLTTSLPRLIAMSLLPGRGPWQAFRRAVEDVDRALAARVERGAPPQSILARLLSAGPTPGELRDEIVTLLAAGHETTATALSWALERLARHPGVLEELRAGEPGYADAVVKEVLRLRPVLSITPRQTAAAFAVGGHVLPPGVHVAPCIWLAHRRTAAYPDPEAFRPERWLVEDPPSGAAFIPWGGGVRRCLGAAFATMELREVLGVVVRRVTLAPDRRRGEAVRRRSVTLAPARGARIIPSPRRVASPW